MSVSTLSPNAATIEQNLLDYFETHDLKYVNDNAKFRLLNTGEQYTGKADIGAMLHYMFSVAFNAKLERTSHLVSENKAYVEGFFTGTHVGEFAGIPPTNKKVRVPACVTYDLKDGRIQEARIYMLGEVLMQQLNS